MNEQEYLVEERDVLSGVPKEFHSWFSYKAYEMGHHAGFEEILCCLRNLVDGFGEAVEKFRYTVYTQATKKD